MHLLANGGVVVHDAEALGRRQEPQVEVAAWLAHGAQIQLGRAVQQRVETRGVITGLIEDLQRLAPQTCVGVA